MTESPRKNLFTGISMGATLGPSGATYILLMKRSLFVGLPFLPLARRGVSVHISFTFSRTMLQCRSKALTRASSFLLLRHEMRTWVWLRTAVWRIESGPALNSCSSNWVISYSLPYRLAGSSAGRGGEEGRTLTRCEAWSGGPCDGG